MIKLKRIVEQQGTESQYYDLGKDFANFKRMLDGSSDQIKQRFEQIIGSKLNGKRVRARASRGYKQYVKDYEFDITNVTLDDYYDNYVVVAHDNTTPKAKEYFLKPGFKIQILGTASGQPAQDSEKKALEVPVAKPQEQSMMPAQPVKETSNGANRYEEYYDAYSIDSIEQDLKSWLPKILVKPERSLRDFIKGLGWSKGMEKGRRVAMFDLKIPASAVKLRLTPQILEKLLADVASQDGTINTAYKLVNAEPDDKHEEMFIRIKKTMTDRTAI